MKNSTDSAAQGRKCFGLFTRRERWGLSWRGWLAALALAGLLAALWVMNVQPFLAQTRRLDTHILVVEGWVNLHSMDQAAAEFHNGHYDKVFTTGGPIVGLGGYLNDYNTSASLGAQRLVKAGIPAEFVQMVPSHVSGRDRTYSSALALREYFHTNGLAGSNFNVLTEDVHARRTHLLFQEAFGKESQVGIISVPDPDYDHARWWRYSEGVREILGETIAYLYATLLFHPDPPKGEDLQTQ